MGHHFVYGPDQCLMHCTPVQGAARRRRRTRWGSARRTRSRCRRRCSRRQRTQCRCACVSRQYAPTLDSMHVPVCIRFGICPQNGGSARPSVLTHPHIGVFAHVCKCACVPAHYSLTASDALAGRKYSTALAWRRAAVTSEAAALCNLAMPLAPREEAAAADCWADFGRSPHATRRRSFATAFRFSAYRQRQSGSIMTCSSSPMGPQSGLQPPLLATPCEAG